MNAEIKTISHKSHIQGSAKAVNTEMHKHADRTRGRNKYTVRQYNEYTVQYRGDDD